MKGKCILLFAMFFVFLWGTLIYANTEGVDTGFWMITEPAFTHKGHAIQDKKEAAINDTAMKAKVQEPYSRLPLCFIRNDGQMDKAVLFYEKQSAHSTFFTKNGIYLTLVNGQISEKPETMNSKRPHRETQNLKSEVIKLVPLGANKDPEVVAEGMQEGKVNYLIGSRKNWKTNIPIYQAVVYKDIYKNIDMKFYGNNRQLEYDIIVKPGANPSRVRLAYRGIKGWRITNEGDLSIDLENGKVVQKKPYVYQVINGKKVEVEGRFKIHDTRSKRQENRNFAFRNPKSEISNPKSQIANPKFTYGFQVASYDKKYPLYIDPTSLVYSTYFGGNANDDNYVASKSIAIDSSGNVYLTGETISTNLATSTSAYRGSLNNGSNTVNYDAFVTKLDSSLSSIQYCTYLGGSGSETACGIAVDSGGYAYIAGYTTSSDFGTASAYQGNLRGSQDGFVTKLNTAGTGVVYSTYIGGSSDDRCDDIAIDSSGNAYMIGTTWSNDFGTYSAAYANLRGNVDAFVAKLNPSGGSDTAYSTYIGGNGTDTGWAIATDSSGNTYISGDTTSADLGTSTGAFQGNKAGDYDCFLVKLDSNGGTNTGYCTYLGGTDYDKTGAIAVDTSGNAYLTGYTLSNDFPTTSGAYQTSYGGGIKDGFVTKLNSGGSSLSYSTYLGGSGTDTTNCIAVDSFGYAYVVGDTSSSNFPTSDAVYGSHQGGTFDTFVSKLNTSGSGFIYSTYLGGNSDEYAWGIALDSSNNPYIAGYTASSNFPTTSGAYQTSYNTGTWDIFVSKISYSAPTTTEEPIPRATLSINSTSPSSGATGVAVNTKVEAAFSMYMNGSTLNTSTFKLSGGGSNVSGSVSTSGNKATFIPSAALAYNTTYTATITTGAQAANYAGTTLNSDYSWSFTTESAPAATPTPTPSPTPTPASTTDTVAPNGSIAINNDEGYTTSPSVTLNLSATDDAGVTGYYIATSSASPTGTATGWVSVTSAASFANDVSYTLSSGDGTKTVYAFYKDFSGNLSNASSDSIILDTTVPTVIATNPAGSSTAVAVNAAIMATFSEFMDAATIGTSSFMLSGGVNGTITTSIGTTTVATFTPWNALSYNGTYTATITTGAKDLAGNAMTSNKTWSFVTIRQEITPTPTPTPTGTVTPTASPTLSPTPSTTPTPTPTPVITTVAADFTANPTAGKKPLSVQFTDQSTGNISRWKWDFGDDTTDTAQHPTHTYTKKGNYTVSLAVSGRYGSDTKTVENYITVTDKKAALIADFTATPTKGEWPLTVQFTEKCVGDVTGMKWDFGDGATGADKNPSHTYSKAGKYTVKHTAYGNEGSDTKTITDYITVTKRDSTITLSLSPSEITFGESLSLTGQITPALQTDISLDFINQNGGTDTASTSSGTNGSFSLNYLPPSGGSWEVTAGWAGNDDYKDAESVPALFTVNPAQAELTIAPSSSVIQTGKAVDITGTVTVTPDNETTRKKFLGEELNLLRLTPEGSYEDPIAGQATVVEVGLGYQFKDVLLTDLGTWEVWTGLNTDENFKGTSSAHISIEVEQAPKEVAGYAILVEGRVKDESGLDSHNKITNYIYQKLIERGFTDNEIYYFNFDTSQKGVDESPSKNSVLDAIRTWASGKMNASPCPLYIILAGHGEEGKFPVYPDTLTAGDLSDGLDGKSSLVSRLDTEALKEPVIIIIGANRAGSFISDLVPKSTDIKRVVIASCDSGEIAYKAPLPPGETIRYGDYFIYELMKYAARGKTLKKGYELAAETVAAYTENEEGGGQYFDNAAQHALLDDNGDGTGTYGILSSLSGRDGEVASTVILGFGTTTTSLELTEVSGVKTLEAEDSGLTLYAKVSDTSKAGSVWTEITVPGHTLQDGTDTTEQQVIDLPKFSYNSFDEAEQKYLWNDFTDDAFDNFSKVGAYNVFYFARESQSGDISSFMTSDIFRNAKDNKPPTAFDPVFPVYGAETAVALKFRWEESIDPDTDDAVTYDLTVALDEDFNEVYYQQKGMKNNFAVVDKTASLRDETSYYWRVLASDVDGGTTLMGTATAASGNARIFGYVKDQNSAPIESVDISARMIGTSTKAVTVSEEDGYFELKDLAGGRYLLKAEKELYRIYRDTLYLADEETKDVELTMRKLNTMEKRQTISPPKGSAKNIQEPEDNGIGTVTSSRFKSRLANGYPGFVKGFVFDKETTEKIRKATVAAQGTKGSYKTTENGAYFLQLNSGTYTVSADASGYDTSDRKVRVDALSTTTENIGLAQATQPAAIYGQVKDKKSDKPVEGVAVTVGKKGFRESTATDSGGNYSFTALESGKYRIVAAKSGYRKCKKSTHLSAGETKTVNVQMRKK